MFSGTLKVRMDYKSIVSWIGIANPDQHREYLKRVKRENGLSL
ncbi:hypothetical protein CLV48_1131, partial [Cecembia rubra]